MKCAFMIHEDDNVAVAIEALAKGSKAAFQSPGGKVFDISLEDDIPIYHKFALRDIPQGEKVVKYGECIGISAQNIPLGAHVHTHNVKSLNRSSGQGVTSR